MRHELHTEIDIDAPPERVWAMLIDLDRYPEWNPFVTSACGEVAVGARLVNRLASPGGRAATIRPHVTVVEHERVFEWLGHLGVPGLFDGRHRFEVQPNGAGTRFRQVEHFRGLLVRPLRKQLDGPTAAGFEAMNRALKERAEAR